MPGITFIQDLAIVLVVAGVVGWICQSIGLSVILGYLVAGMMIGPYSPLVSLVSSPERIQTLAQVGLIFLIFSIGLRLSVRRLRRLGLSLFVATFAGAFTVYYFCRLFAALAGWTGQEGMFFAAMLMVSSSAVVGKVLQETGATHEPSGQLALGVSILEDVVAVVMLTLLGSMAEFGRGGGGEVFRAVLLLGAFVVLTGVIGLLLVPWLLRRMSIAANEELQALGIAGLLFALAVVAEGAGYSLALGAFLLGTIVAETIHRHQVERTFEGMRDVFSAVFFVAIGLQIDPRLLWRESALVLSVAVFTLLVRSAAVSFGLTLTGTDSREAVRTGLAATAIGEFSFIIAQLGVGHGMIPRSFYPLIVGVCVITTLTAPVLIRRSDRIAGAVLARQPRWLEIWLSAYRGWLERMQARGRRNLLWQLSRKRLAQVAVGMLFVTGLVVFSEQLFGLAEQWIGRNWLFPRDLEIVFWTALVLLSLAPLVAIWRNLSAMALLYAEVSTRGHAHANRLRPVVETTLKIAAGAGLVTWLLAVVPVGETAKWLLVSSGIVALAALIMLRRKLIYWHSEMEIELMSVITGGETQMSATTAPWLQPHGEWNLHMVDCTLPDLADCQGRPILDLDLRTRFGCSVVGIERQGFMIPLPSPDTVLYPRDKVLLLGTTDQIRAGREFLTTVTGARSAESLFEEVSMEAMTVPSWSRAVGHTLGELSPAKQYGVQIAGIHRGGLRILNPNAHEELRASDEVLVLGTPSDTARFKAWLRERPESVEKS